MANYRRKPSVYNPQPTNPNTQHKIMQFSSRKILVFKNSIIHFYECYDPS